MRSPKIASDLRLLSVKAIFLHICPSVLIQYYLNAPSSPFHVEQQVLILHHGAGIPIRRFSFMRLGPLRLTTHKAQLPYSNSPLALTIPPLSLRCLQTAIGLYAGQMEIRTIPAPYMLQAIPTLLPNLD